MHYVAQNKNCSGILSPVINGKRHFYDIELKEYKLMEALESEAAILEIGKYKFSQSAFSWAEKKLDAKLKSTTELLIIDEIGPLELKGQGFADFLKKNLKTNTPILNLLIVVREQAVKQVLEYFEIDETKVRDWNWK